MSPLTRLLRDILAAIVGLALALVIVEAVSTRFAPTVIEALSSLYLAAIDLLHKGLALFERWLTVPANRQELWELGVCMATVYGLMLGFIRFKSEGLLAPFLAHIFADLTIIIVVFGRAGII